MADHLRRPYKKHLHRHLPSDAAEEPLSKRPCLSSCADQETPEIDDAAPINLKPGLRRQTQPCQAVKPLRLTKKNLRLFDAMRTGTTKMKPSTSASTCNGTSGGSSKMTTSTLGTTTSGFQEQALANGILTPRRSKPPHNTARTLERLNRSRRTASPTSSQYRRDCGKIETAGNEVTVMTRILPLFKDYDDTYTMDSNRVFSALPKDVGFNNSLSAPLPDFVEGLTKEEFLPVDPATIQGAVLFEDDTTSTTLPHLAGEWKSSRSGKINEATLQSSYDGAAMVYGRNQALNGYLAKTDPPGHSAITTFASNGEHISFFAHYASPAGEDTGRAIDYHQHRLTRTDLTESYESFKKGRRQIRNAQDYAQEQSFDSRDRLRKKWNMKSQQT